MSHFYKAAVSHWTAQKDEAIATLELYFQKSVGIGEHSKILEEINDWTSKLSEAEENLLSLEKHFEDDGYVRDKPKKVVINGEHFKKYIILCTCFSFYITYIILYSISCEYTILPIVELVNPKYIWIT